MPHLKDVKLHIAGRNTPDHIQALDLPNVEVHGEVEDALGFIDNHDIMVVPLLSGSGIRVKILEGMAMGKVVVTTSKGMEGIGAKDGKEVLVADDKSSFADRIQWAVDHPDEVKAMGQRARDFVKEFYDAGLLARNLIHAYDKALSGKLQPFLSFEIISIDHLAQDGLLVGSSYFRICDLVRHFHNLRLPFGVLLCDLP